METKMINEHSCSATVLPHGSKSHRQPCDFATRPSEASEAIVPQTIGICHVENKIQGLSEL